MNLYLPIAEMTINPFLMLCLGGVVGVLSGLFGVGGGFLSTPFLIFAGVPPSIAVGTQSIQLAASSLAGCLGHWRRGNIDQGLGLYLMTGGAVGAVCGIALFHLLTWIGQIDFIILFLYVFLLGGIGASMLWENMATLWRRHRALPPDPARLPFLVRWTRSWPNARSFDRMPQPISVRVPLAIGAVGGMLVSLMGIGGGFLIVPALIYGLGLAPMLAAGTSLFQIVGTASFVSLLHAASTQTIDPFLALILMIGSVAGAQIGVRLSRRIRGRQARVLLAILITLVAIKMAGDLFLPPLDPFSVEGG